MKPFSNMVAMELSARSPGGNDEDHAWFSRNSRSIESGAAGGNVHEAFPEREGSSTKERFKKRRMSVVDGSFKIDMLNCTLR